MDQGNRVVVLIDMDCFYCQVEEKLNPELKGKPIAVVQYNPWQGGGIIAVNYIARAQGVKRGMRGNEAKEKCPDIELPSVPCTRGKADIHRYREAGKEVARVLQKFTPLLERASIDEAYLDITTPVEERLKTLNLNTVNTNMMPNTYALGYDDIEGFISDVHSPCMDHIDFDYEHAKRLLVGAVIVSEIRNAVYAETGYKCSAGIAHNKILAKLVCGFNKPNKQTILPKHSVDILYSTLPVKKVKHLGGKFGDSVCEILKIREMGELQKFTEKFLQARFDEKNGTWLYNIARGIDLEPVQVRFNPKSIGCCKNFPGKSALLHLDNVRKWLKDLGEEIDDRLEQDALENNRTPKQMVVSFSTQMPDGRDVSSSRSYNFVADDELCGELFSSKALELLIESSEGVKVKEDEGDRRLKAPIKFLGISVGKFEDNSETKKTRKILDYFSAGSSKELVDKPKNVKHEDNRIDKTKSNLKNSGKEYILQKFFQVTGKPENVKPQSEIKLNEISKDMQNQILELDAGSAQYTESLKYQNVETLKSQNMATVKPENIETLQSQNVETLKSQNMAIVKPENIETLQSQNTAPLQSHKNGPIVESSLDKQESFFAKILNQNAKKDPRFNNIESEEKTRPITPLCDVVNCQEDSNDTNYSGSTINDEIDKSMALFEDDPEDVARVSNMRELLNSSKVINENVDRTETVSPEPEQVPEVTPQIEPQTVETFDCTECGKSIPIEAIEMHSDYHVALRLRDEERQQVRKEKLEKTLVKHKPDESKKKKRPEESNKNKSISSIAGFLVKIDNNVPNETCQECGKRIPIEKFTEHLDFHEAQKLNRELNKKIIPQISGTSIAKRKRKSASPITKNTKLCTSKNSLFK